jgi:hypothetical protein
MFFGFIFMQICPIMIQFALEFALFLQFWIKWSIIRLSIPSKITAWFHSSNLSGEEDEQSTPKWCHFGKKCNSPSTSDASQLHLWLASNFQFRSISPLTNFNFSPRFQRLLYFGPWSQFFFNLTSNWPLKFQISSISPLISINWVPRVWLLLQNGHWLWISSI